MPVFLGNSITEPLMGYFVCQQTFNFSFSCDRVFIVEDASRIFHAAVNGFRLNICKFLESKGSKEFIIEFYYSDSRSIIEKPLFHIFRINPCLYGGPISISCHFYCKLGCTHNHDLGGKGHIRLPVVYRSGSFNIILPV